MKLHKLFEILNNKLESSISNMNLLYLKGMARIAKKITKEKLSHDFHCENYPFILLCIELIFPLP